MSAKVNHKGGPYILRFWAKSEVDGVGELFWWTKRFVNQLVGDTLPFHSVG